MTNNSRNQIKAIVFHEWRLIRKEPRFFLPYVLIMFLLLGSYSLIIVTSHLHGEDVKAISPLLLLFISALTGSMALALSADSFAGERERNTLETLMCAPISYRVLFAGKLAGIYVFPVVAGWLGQGALILTVNFLLPSGFCPAEIMLSFIFTPVFSLLVISLAVYVSLRAPTVRSAAQYSGALFLLILFGIQFLSRWYLMSGINALIALGAFCLLSYFLLMVSVYRFKNVLTSGSQYS
jgi:ABC-type Na+ efflux pump permease subunit